MILLGLAFIQKFPLHLSRSAACDPPQATTATDAIKDEHQRTVNRGADVPRSRLGLRDRVRMKSTHNVLPQRFRCSRNPANLFGAKQKTPAPLRHVGSLNERKTETGLDEKSAYLSAR